MSEPTRVEVLRQVVLRRQVVRQALLQLALTDLGMPPLRTAGGIELATRDHLYRTARDSRMLRSLAPLPELTAACDHLNSHLGTYVTSARWAPAAADQLAHVLLRMLAHLEGRARRLDEQAQAEPEPEPSPATFHVGREPGE